jgi:hypothetical protein
MFYIYISFKFVSIIFPNLSFKCSMDERFLFIFFLIYFISFYYSFIHMCIHCLGHFSPLPPSPTLSLLPQFQAGPVLPLSLVLLKKRDKPNKEDKVFFSSWVKDSHTEIFLTLLLCTCVMTHVDLSLTDLYPGYWFPSHDTSVALRFLY